MKPRTALHILIGLLVSIALVFFASNLVAGSGSSLAEMMSAQRRTPVLWVVDVCAVGVLGGMWWYAVMLNQFQDFVDNQSKQHHEQLEDMIERTSDLERVNDNYADRIERLEAELARQFRDLTDQVMTLETASDARRKVFEIETRRISEHAYRIFQAQLEANTRHVEAMNMALQFQRGELRRLRHEFRELQQELAPRLALRQRPVDFMAAGEEQLAIGPSGADTNAPAGDSQTGTYETLVGQRGGAAPDSSGANDRERTAPGYSLESARSEDAEASPSQGSGSECRPAENGADWLSDYAANAERNSGWKSQVERLFYEAPTMESSSGEAASPHDSLSMPALRIVASGETGSAADLEIAASAADGHDSEGAQPERPTPSEATA